MDDILDTVFIAIGKHVTHYQTFKAHNEKGKQALNSASN